jgi:hypothetical protein
MLWYYVVNKTHWNIIVKEGLLYYSLLLVTNKELLYLFIVTTQQDAFTHNKDHHKLLVLRTYDQTVSLQHNFLCIIIKDESHPINNNTDM